MKNIYITSQNNSKNLGTVIFSQMASEVDVWTSLCSDVHGMNFSGLNRPKGALYYVY